MMELIWPIALDPVSASLAMYMYAEQQNLLRNVVLIRMKVNVTFSFFFNFLSEFTQRVIKMEVWPLCFY